MAWPGVDYRIWKRGFPYDMHEFELKEKGDKLRLYDGLFESLVLQPCGQSFVDKNAHSVKLLADLNVYIIPSFVGICYESVKVMIALYLEF